MARQRCVSPVEAVPASAAGDVDRRCHAIAELPLRDAVAQLDDLAGEFVPDDPRQFAQAADGPTADAGRCCTTRWRDLDQHLAAGRADGIGRSHHLQRAAVARRSPPRASCPAMRSLLQTGDGDALDEGALQTKNSRIIGRVPSTAIAIS